MKGNCFIVLLLILFVTPSTFAEQPDTLKIMLVDKAPVFDGKANDAVWNKAQWISIDQVWMPWKGHISTKDFSGRFKVLWSEKTNLLYFVAEITDDVFRDGFIYEGANSRNYSDYDIFEVFLDPDHSGGMHVFDETGENGVKWGTNAQNAFTYHISVNSPANGKITHKKTVEDIAGTSWTDIRNYSDHLPDFAFRKKGNTYTYEFSLKVYKDTYKPDSPSENDRDKLYTGKIMGLATAYCDDDHSTGKPIRDNFIGSVHGAESALEWDEARKEYVFNQTWKNASYFGVAQLVNYKPNPHSNKKK
ncbi:MAG: sugar-binding protein [Bacteroidota bacterium]|nr:sugar-binding protein [Bacteroidota bacterium]